MPAAERKRLSPWVIAIVAGLTLVATVNVIFIVVAFRGADPVVSSYQLEPR